MMTLIVYPYHRNLATGQMIDCDEEPTAPYNDLFGFESWRKTVWGSAILENFNLELLPTLSDTSIFAEGQDLDKLFNEIKIIQANANWIAETLELYQDSFEFRLNNAIEAIRIAKKYSNGGVHIG